MTVVCEDGTLMSLQPVLNREENSETFDPEQVARNMRVFEFWSQSISMPVRLNDNEVTFNDRSTPATEIVGLGTFRVWQQQTPEEGNVIR